MGDPYDGWFIMEHPINIINKDDLGHGIFHDIIYMINIIIMGYPYFYDGVALF